MQGISRTKQTLSDASVSTNLEDVFGNLLWFTVITKTRLTKKFLTDEEGAGLLLPRMLVEKSRADMQIECSEDATRIE